jgi:hypothetical protein
MEGHETKDGRSSKEKGVERRSIRDHQTSGAILMLPDQVTRIRVITADGLEVEHVVRARPDGTMLTHQAPDPAPPVQDPDPISGT